MPLSHAARQTPIFTEIQQKVCSCELAAGNMDSLKVAPKVLGQQVTQALSLSRMSTNAILNPL
jgi:hypothetical protein